MADDRDPDGPAPGPADGAGPSAGPPDEPDQTREYDPFADDDEARPASGGAAGTDASRFPPADDETRQLPGDETRQVPPVGDETRPMPPVGDETRRMPPVDETRQAPRVGDETRPMPPVDETAHEPSRPAAWSGRAGVPPPKAVVVRGPAPAEWVPPENGEGRWWTPIVLGIVALLLLGGLVAGIWLIYDANKVDPAPTPPPRTLAPTSAPRTSAAPPTTSAPAPTTAPAGVPVPRLVGLTDEQARDELDRIGLSYRLVYRPASEAPNTVIETDPAEGEVVPDGTEVTLVIASPLSPTPPPTVPTPEPTPTA